MQLMLKREKRYRRHKRVRAKISGTLKVPRLSIFRSSKHIYAQLIDDEKGRTLASASDQGLKLKMKNKKEKTTIKKEKPDEKTMSGKVYIAYNVGKMIAQKALAKKITKVVFDRGGYKYHGRVKALADGAREGGLKF